MAALMTSSRDLPIEMITSILARLPYKSLLRFRRSCKLDGIDLCLWNPSIRKSKLLPKSHSPIDENGFSTILAFGFVPRLNDYMVLKTAKKDWYKKKIRKTSVKFEIYSMNTHSWKLLDNVVSWLLLDTGIGLITVMNGVVYLKASSFKAGDGYEEFILTFDMADEEFGKINIPQFSRIYIQDEEIPPFVVGQLGMFFILSFHNEHVSDIWMKEHDAAESWTKKLTIDQCVGLLGVLKNGELVLEYSDPDRLTSYDPRLPEPKDLQFDVAPWWVYSFNHYLESLVLLNEGN